MILDEKKIISATIGAVRTVKEGNGIGFRRFSEKQEIAFDGKKAYFGSDFEHYFYNNSLCSAGICLDFITDAKSVVIKAGGEPKNDKLPKISCDILADGRRVKTQSGETVTVSFRNKKERRITVYLSVGGRDCISEVELADADIFRPYYKQGTDILFFGDSIFQGIGTRHASCTMPTIVGRRLNARIMNQGNNGYVYDANTLDKICEPKLIVLGYGCNDRDRKSENDFYNDALAFAKKVRELWKDIPAVGVLPVYCGADAEPDYIKWYRKCDDLLRKAYEETNIAVINGQELIPHDITYFNPDYHPNDKGYLIYGNRLAKRLVEMGLYK